MSHVQFVMVSCSFLLNRQILSNTFFCQAALWICFVSPIIGISPMCTQDWTEDIPGLDVQECHGSPWPLLPWSLSCSWCPSQVSQRLLRFSNDSPLQNKNGLSLSKMDIQAWRSHSVTPLGWIPGIKVHFNYSLYEGKTLPGFSCCVFQWCGID